MEVLANFRDLGSIKTINGKKVKGKKVLRSAQLVNLSENDNKEFLKTYHLTKIIDFRGEQEIADAPDDNLKGVDYVHIDILAGKQNSATNFKEMIKVVTVEKVDELMKETYEQLVCDPKAQKGYQRFFEELLNQEEGSLIFHCFAGKDRTGIGAMLFLKLLGVSDEAVLKDYLRTNSERAAENKRLVNKYLGETLEPEKEKALLRILSVDSSYMEHAMTLIRQKYGTIDSYAKECLNLNDEKIKKLKMMYLED